LEVLVQVGYRAKLSETRWYSTSRPIA
jgi:hypothetical protein